MCVCVSEPTLEGIRPTCASYQRTPGGSITTPHPRTSVDNSVLTCQQHCAGISTRTRSVQATLPPRLRLTLASSTVALLGMVWKKTFPHHRNSGGGDIKSKQSNQLPFIKRISAPHPSRAISSYRIWRARGRGFCPEGKEQTGTTMQAQRRRKRRRCSSAICSADPMAWLLIATHRYSQLGFPASSYGQFQNGEEIGPQLWVLKKKEICESILNI